MQVIFFLVNLKNNKPEFLVSHVEINDKVVTVYFTNINQILRPCDFICQINFKEENKQQFIIPSVPVSPKADVPVSPKADVPVSPKADVPVSPKADVPVSPKADVAPSVPVSPKADVTSVPSTPKADVTSVPSTPKADVTSVPATPKSEGTFTGINFNFMPATPKSTPRIDVNALSSSLLVDINQNKSPLAVFKKIRV